MLDYTSTFLINEVLSVGDMMLELFLNTVLHCHSNFKSWAKMSNTERGEVSPESKVLLPKQKFNNIKHQINSSPSGWRIFPHHEQAD